jgi:hypothetical protein
MSTMALLTYGRDHKLCKKRGWLKDLLISEGICTILMYMKIVINVLVFLFCN